MEKYCTPYRVKKSEEDLHMQLHEHHMSTHVQQYSKNVEIGKNKNKCAVAGLGGAFVFYVDIYNFHPKVGEILTIQANRGSQWC
jgi:hypothetical protein